MHRRAPFVGTASVQPSPSSPRRLAAFAAGIACALLFAAVGIAEARQAPPPGPGAALPSFQALQSSRPAHESFQEGSLDFVHGRIANGVITSLPPSVGLLLVDGSACTATLIGCRTLLTAAHCFCGEADTAGQCQPSSGAVAFFQHAGFAAVSSVSIHPGFEFGVASDLAVARLAQPVTGIEPADLNTTRKPTVASAGLIVGFGLDGEGAGAVDGLKRQGLVVTERCSQGIPDAAHLCWHFAPPLGNPGEDSNTCAGDSGGPLFVDFGSGPVLAGVTSGGTGPCDGTDMAFDADVFRDRAWIQQQAGADLGQTCGGLPAAGSAGAPILFGAGSLNAANPDQTFSLTVPAGTDRLRVTLNGPDTHDFDLVANPGNQASPAGAPCFSENDITLEACEIVDPTPGPWALQAFRFAGSGPYQITATVFAGQQTPGSPCVPDATTLCIDDEPGDRRFRLTLAYDSVLGGGISGDALATPLASLGITRGGIFAFTNPANPEALVKVLDGCAVNGHFWVFAAATTTVGFRLEVEDTREGESAVYVNPDRTAAATVTDTEALATCP